MNKQEVSQLQRFLDDHEGDHFNGFTDVTYKISTGSLRADRIMEGGYGPGIHRIGGASEGGKTSHVLKVAANFLETVPNAKVLYIKAEGRLGKRMIKRSGIKFVQDANEWEAGTAFVFKSNIYDSVGALIESLIEDNPNGYKYMFIIDSVDSMIMKNDKQKRLDGDDAVKVAGPNVFTKLLFKKCSLACTTLGHMLFVIAQVIAKIEIGHKKSDQLNVSGAGGNAQIHFADWCMFFEPRFQGDLLVNDGVSPGPNNKVEYDADKTNIVGHWAKIIIQKSMNEKTSQTIRYPIRYNADGDGSIWTELEIKNELENLQLIEAKGAWINFADMAVEMMKDAGLDAQAKHNGNKKFLAFVSNPDILKFWTNYIKRAFEDDEIL